MRPNFVKSIKQMKTTKKIILAGVACFYVSGLFAGGLLTNTNQSVHFLRNPARDASTEIDAAYTNPAGLAKLPADGLHFSFNNQSAFQTRTITSTFGIAQANIYPFTGFGGNATKVYEGEAAAPIIPSLFGAYKKGKWVLSGNIAVTGGGGKATFNKGLPSFESSIAMLPLAINQIGAAVPALGLSANKYSVDAYMEGSSIIYGAQLGGTYEINNMFSAYAGFRMNFVNNGYVGHLKEIMVNPNSTTMPTVLGNGTMVSATEYFGGLSKNPMFSSIAGKLDTLSYSTKDMELDCSQSGWGVTPILGVNFSWKSLNIGMKYEFKTSLNVENKTKKNTLPTGKKEAFDNGVNTPHDIPALFTIGAKYDIIPSVTVSCGYHHFFDSDAKMANDKQKYIDGGINEYLFGAEWQIDKMFLISAGGQITRTGVTDDYQTDLSYSLNSYSIGFGGAVNVSKSVRINIGYFFTNYEDWTKEYPENYNNTNMPGTDVFSRTNKVFGAGVDFRF